MATLRTWNQDRARKEVWNQQVFYKILVTAPERYDLAGNPNNFQ